MVNQKENEEKLKTAFTVTVDAKYGTTTGVSARDRVTTILALASRDSKPEDFNRPGHIFLLKYREGGVLKRAGHTEASVDLAMLAGLSTAGVLCEVVDDDGSMARMPRLLKFVEKENLKILSIFAFNCYTGGKEKLVELVAATWLPTVSGDFTAHCYRSKQDYIDHIAMVKMLQELWVRNNQTKYVGLKGYGLTLLGRVPLMTPITKENRRYLETKRAKKVHVYGTNGDMKPSDVTRNQLM